MRKIHDYKRIFVLALTFVAAIVLLMPRTWADDAMEALAPSEIQFDKTSDISMLDETLTITKSGKTFTSQSYSVDVDFHFKNVSDHEITRRIAFTLPPVRCDLETDVMWQGLENGDPYEKGLKDFSVTVDGRSVSYSTRKEAMIGQRNVTAFLEQNNVPLNPCMIKQKPNAPYSPLFSDTLKSNGLLNTDHGPAWSEHIYFEWMQVFPAGKVVSIHHHYTPVVGTTVPAPRTIAELNSPYNESIPANYLWSRNLTTLADVKPSIIAKNENASDLRSQFCVIPTWILYSLTTGAYWNGGIGVFKLIVKDNSGAPFAVSEFYNPADPVQSYMTSNSMTITIDNFTPRKDLLVLFLALPQTPEDLKQCGIVN